MELSTTRLTRAVLVLLAATTMAGLLVSRWYVALALLAAAEAAWCVARSTSV